MRNKGAITLKGRRSSVESVPTNEWEGFIDLGVAEDEPAPPDEPAASWDEEDVEAAKEEAKALKGFEEDSVKTYLREISRHKLLNGREEIELARAIRNGDKAARRKLIQANL